MPGGSTSHADLARALLDDLDDPATVRHAIGVAGLSSSARRGAARGTLAGE